MNGRFGHMADAALCGTGPRTAGWPLQSLLELGALPGAVPCARLHVRQVLWEWGIGNVAEAAELVVSELVTNAVKASPPVPETDTGLHVSLQLEANVRGSLVVQVGDGHSDPPVRGEVDEDAESGRGLLIVEALCDDWGWYWPDGGEHGKWVWAAMVR
jgi:anti-sigma regulatory factor (Ser/Thr protein kinase)